MIMETCRIAYQHAFEIYYSSFSQLIFSSKIVQPTRSDNTTAGFNLKQWVACAYLFNWYVHTVVLKYNRHMQIQHVVYQLDFKLCPLKSWFFACSLILSSRKLSNSRRQATIIKSPVINNWSDRPLSKGKHKYSQQHLLKKIIIKSNQINRFKLQNQLRRSNCWIVIIATYLI